MEKSPNHKMNQSPNKKPPAQIGTRGECLAVPPKLTPAKGHPLYQSTFDVRESTSPVTEGKRLRLPVGQIGNLPYVHRSGSRGNFVWVGLCADFSLMTALLCQLLPNYFPGHCRWKGSPVGGNYRQILRNVKVGYNRPGPRNKLMKYLFRPIHLVRAAMR
jgi:hypothetical protein